MRGNEGDFVAIDRFSFDVPEVRGRQLPRASREGLEESLRPLRRGARDDPRGDAFELIEGGALGDRRVGVYYWDGPHDYDSQLRGMRAVEPWLAPEALILVDDYDWEEVAPGDARLPRRRAEGGAARRDRRRGGRPGRGGGTASPSSAGAGVSLRPRARGRRPSTR